MLLNSTWRIILGKKLIVVLGLKFDNGLKRKKNM